jgi:hypothetical protein
MNTTDSDFTMPLARQAGHALSAWPVARGGSRAKP